MNRQTRPTDPDHSLHDDCASPATLHDYTKLSLETLVVVFSFIALALLLAVAANLAAAVTL